MRSALALSWVLPVVRAVFWDAIRMVAHVSATKFEGIIPHPFGRFLLFATFVDRTKVPCNNGAGWRQAGPFLGADVAQWKSGRFISARSEDRNLPSALVPPRSLLVGG